MALLGNRKARETSVEGSHTARDTAPRAPDGELMAAFVRREPSASAVLYDRYASRIYGLGLVLLKNTTDAEDLVQDTFLKAMHRGSAYDPYRGSLDTWILLMARNLAIDLLRRRTVESRILASVARRSDVSDEPDPEHQAVQGDLMERTRAALDRIPGKQRTAVQLAYLGDQSSSQVAALEGVPLGTAKSRIRLGVFALRQFLAADEGP